MITTIFDTNAVIALLGQKSEKLTKRILSAAPGSIALPSIVASELYYGAYRSAKVDYNLETLRLLFADLPLLDFDRQDALAAGNIRADLARRGTPIGPYDVLIAGVAKARRLTLVTNNLREFSRVPGLVVEDWAA